MRIWIAVALAAALPVAAHAEPKTIIIDGCAKVETELRNEVSPGGSRVTNTVKCTGTADDPKVREKATLNYLGGAILTAPGTGMCVNGEGKSVSC